MATLEKIRTKASWLLVGFVGLALIAFVLGMGNGSGKRSIFPFLNRSQEHETAVIIVNGKTVGIHEFQKRIEEMTEVYKMRTGEQNPREEDHAQIRESVYQSMIQEILLEQAAEALGITVPADEVLEMATGDGTPSAFQQNFINPETGEFDKEAALNFVKVMEDNEVAVSMGLDPTTLAMQRAYWQAVKRSFITECLRTKIGTLLIKSQGTNQLDAQLSYENNKITSDFAYILQPYSQIPDSIIEVSEAELKKLYNQRKESWKHDGERTADLLVVNVDPSAEDLNNVEDEVSKIKEEFVTSDDVSDLVNRYSDYRYVDYYINEELLDTDMRNFATTANINAVEGPFMKDNTFRMMKLIGKKIAPDSIKVSIIVLGEAADQANQNLSDSLMNVINKGASFETLAREHSKDPSSQQGGEMGWFTEATALAAIGPDFRDLIFSSPINQTKPFSFRNSLFLIKVTDKSKDKPMYKIADIVIKVIPSTQTQNDLYNKLGSFLSKNKDVTTFANAARDAGYNIMPDQVVTSSDPSVSNLKSSRQVIRWVFNAKKGAISEIFECDDKFVVAGLKNISPKGFRPLNEVMGMLKFEIIREKKGEKITSDINAMNTGLLGGHAEELGVRIDSARYVQFSTSRIVNVGPEPKLNAAAVALPENKLSPPIVGNNGVYLLSIYNQTENTIPFDLEAEKAKIENMRSPQMLSYQFLQTLRNQSEIEDNRIRFY